MSNIVTWLHFKQLTVATAELSFFCCLYWQGCVPVKWTAPEVLFGDIASLSNKSYVYVILFMKLLNYFLFFCDERMIFPRGWGVTALFGYGYALLDRAWFLASLSKTGYTIGRLQLAITWYKIRLAGGQAHYYSRTGTLKQRELNHWSLTFLCFDVPVRE